MRRTLSAFFEHYRSDHSFESLRAQADRLLAMQTAIDKRWPAMQLRVLAVRDDTLVLEAPNSALAAKCRQVGPSLVEAVAPHAPTVRQVKVKAAPRNPVQAPTPRDKSLGDAPLEQLQDAASGLPPGRLRAALQRMIRRQLEQ